MPLSPAAIRNENPWNGLAKRAPYALRADAQRIEDYNQDRKIKPENRVHLELPPSPFVGSPTSIRVLLLTKNPAWHPEDVVDFTEKPEYARQMWQNLTFGNEEFPFYTLNPAFEDTFGYQWWDPRLKELIEACDEKTDGKGRECVARGLFSIAFFPYHANEFNGEITELRCQKFARELVRLYRDEEVPIVITGPPALWTKALPKLAGRYYPASSRQASYISRGNLPKGAFDLVVEALTRPDAPAPVEETTAPEPELVEAA